MLHFVAIQKWRSTATPRDDSAVNDWRASLALARASLGLTRARLAGLAGVSAATIRGYEDGSRHPKRDSLEAILSALRLERVEGNAIRYGAGFASVHSLFAHQPGYYFDVPELDEEVERVPWPEFVTNDSFEIVAANRTAAAVWGVDFHAEWSRRSPSERNLLAIASERDFPARIENWDDIVELLAAMYKGKGDGPEDMAEPSPYFAEVLTQFTDNNPAMLARLLQAWNRAEAYPPKVRETYSVIWNHETHGRMTFHCMVTTANERDGLAFSDWIPIDGRTWTAIDSILRDLGEDPEQTRNVLLHRRTGRNNAADRR